MNRRNRLVAQVLVGVLILLVGFAGPVRTARAQDLEAPTPTGRDLPPTNRLDILAVSLGLTKEQKETAKARLDAAHEGAAAVRTRLHATRAAIVAAVQAGRPQADIDAAVATHAAEITAMTQLEVRALAEVLAMLTPEQQAKARTAGIRTPFFLFRGIFLDDRRWNVEPATSGY
jgi:Spy/CpxP family protein refolding chaperone